MAASASRAIDGAPFVEAKRPAALPKKFVSELSKRVDQRGFDCHLQARLVVCGAPRTQDQIVDKEQLIVGLDEILSVD
jgi:hypothetical protein